jgi:hypothetical protein
MTGDKLCVILGLSDEDERAKIAELDGRRMVDQGVIVKEITAVPVALNFSN